MDRTNRTNRIEDILSNEDFKNQLIKEVFDKEVEQAGSLSGNPEAHLSGYLKEIDEKSFEDIYRKFIENYSYTLNKRVPSTNGEEEKKIESLNDGDSVNPEKELKAMNDLTVETASLATGITVGSGNGNVTDVLDSTQETDFVSNDEEANLHDAVINEPLEEIGMDGGDIANDNVAVASPVEEDGDDIGENHEVVSEISDTDTSDSVSSNSRARERSSSSPQGAYPPHLSRCPVPCQLHPVRNCQTSMGIVEAVFQQNKILSTQKMYLQQEVSKLRQEVASFGRKLNETAEKLQQTVHDKTELDRTLAYLRQVLAERKEKVKNLEKEIQLLNNKCKLTDKTYQMENAIAECLKDLPKETEQNTQLIENLLEENRTLKAKNEDLREQNKSLSTQLEHVTENATTEMIENLKEENRTLKAENKELKERSKEERSALEAQNEELREQLKEEKCAHEAQNEELREQNESLSTQLECVTENATAEDELYVRRMTQIECCINEEVRKLRKAYSCLQTVAMSHGLQLPLGSAEPQDEMDD